MFTRAFYKKYVHNPKDKTPEKIASNPRWFPFFKYCRGAVDGVHVLAYILSPDIGSSHRMSLLSVISWCASSISWLGGGQLFNCTCRNGFSLPVGCYYLADAGFPNCDLRLMPYRGIQYHLNKWKKGKQWPQNPEELFNLRHAQLQNVIEQIFGVLKCQFHILLARPEFDYDQQAMMVGAAASTQLPLNTWAWSTWGRRRGLWHWRTTISSKCTQG